MKTTDERIKALFTRQTADMYLPKNMRTLAIFFIGVAFILGALLHWRGWLLTALLASPILLILISVLMILCTERQMLVILPEDTFAYRTFMGNIYVYRFSDITQIKINMDSMQLIVAGKLVHLERLAFKSDTLMKKLQQVQQRLRDEAIARLRHDDQSSEL